MQKFRTMALSLILAAFLSGAAFAQGDSSEIPAQVSKEHWACKELTELSAKYGAPASLPQKEVLEKKELASQLLSLMDKVLEKCEKEGPEAVPAHDLEQLAALHQALQGELAQYEGYEVRREAIEKMLAKPETPEFLYKAGVNGFLRGEGVRNFHLPDFSYTPDHGEGRFLYRVKPYLYWHPTDWLDIHAEGQGYGYRGGSHQEYNKFSLYQGFVQARIPGSDVVTLKGGRQEFEYGSAFILGPEAFYDGLSFDSVLLRVKPVEPLTVDVLAGSYATPFSNGIEGNLAGAYATWAFSENNTLEAYAFRDSGSDDHHGGEYRATWGLRGTARVGNVALEVEPVYQSGKTFNSVREANDRIEAYGGHVDLSSEGNIGGYNNKFFGSFAYGSGSSEAANGVSGRREFVNQNTDSSLTGDMNVIGDLSGIDVGDHHASGVQIYTLGWGIDLTKDLNFSATGRYFRANKVEEGFSKNLGLETDFTVTYNVSDALSFILGYDRFFTGNFFRNATGSGDDIDYTYLMLQFDISKSKPKAKARKG
ncbi:alginate export family protein [Geomonas sp. RF6]|uniref:alginate export family protein n=1 Tax=Geomonas sp. RF6 TaxID=2897342 RepID=UPI001E578FDB|nr:alginate export family protein [Geomonas sp. RF6]UFS70811.1 alginate export family protein [Geomonas sp. RF6]